MLEKVKMNLLLDLYGPLLTDKQRKICEYYYGLDLSLQEIAELENISRSAVHDMIKRVQNELKNYERLLHLLENRNKREKIYKHLEQTNNKEVLKDIKHLRNIEEGNHE